MIGISDVHPDRLSNGKQHEDALTLLLSHVRGREVNFARLHSEVHPDDVGIYDGMYIPADGQCGIWLMFNHMMTQVRCGIAWDMYLIVD